MHRLPNRIQDPEDLEWYISENSKGNEYLKSCVLCFKDITHYWSSPLVRRATSKSI